MKEKILTTEEGSQATDEEIIGDLQEGIRFMKLNPKLAWGFLVFLLAATFIVLAFLTILSSQIKSKNSLLLSSQENKFKVSLYVAKESKSALLNLISNLELPAELQEGLTFELDSTSSAKLTLLTPITVDFNVRDNEIIYTGTLNRPLNQNQLEVKPIKIPKDTSLALFAPDLSDLLLSKFALSQGSKSLLSEKLSSPSGHYLIFFGPKPELALIYNKENLDLGNLKEIPLEASSQAGTGSQDTKVYSPKLLQSETQPGVFLQVQNYTVFASSLDAAKTIINSQNSHLTFPANTQNSTSFIFNFFGENSQNLSSDFTKAAFSKGISTSSGLEKIQKTLAKIKMAEFSLKGSTFSGLISVK